MARYDADVGLFAQHDRAQLPPAPERPSFGGIVAEGLDTTPGLTAVADTSIGELGGVDGGHVDGVYADVLGGAADSAQSEADETSSSPAGTLADSGGRVDARAAQVHPYLPGPDTGVQMNLIDPPQAPNLSGGGGGPAPGGDQGGDQGGI